MLVLSHDGGQVGMAVDGLPSEDGSERVVTVGVKGMERQVRLWGLFAMLLFVETLKQENWFPFM